MCKLLVRFILLALGVSCVRAMNMNHDPHVCVSARFTGHGEGEFFTSFAHPETKYYPVMFFVDTVEKTAMVDRVPYIGHYQSEGTKKSGKTHGDWYNPRVRLALIELAPKFWRFFVPGPLKDALKSVGISDLSAVEYFVNIVGNFDRLNEAPIVSKDINSCNAAFHPIIRRWHGTQDANFNVPVQAGIFGMSGVHAYPGGIALNSLARLDVNYHDRDNFSPDNGRFYYDPKQGIATFWTVVVYDRHANVTLNVIATNEETEKRLMRIMDASDIGVVLASLYDVSTAMHVTGLMDVITILEGQSGIHHGEPFVGRGKTLAVRAASSEKPRERELSRRELIAHAAEKRHEKATERRRPVAGSSRAPFAHRAEPADEIEGYVDNLVAQFNHALAVADFDVAYQLLVEIKNLNPARAEHYTDLFVQARSVFRE